MPFKNVGYYENTTKTRKTTTTFLKNQENVHSEKSFHRILKLIPPIERGEHCAHDRLLTSYVEIVSERRFTSKGGKFCHFKG